MIGMNRVITKGLLHSVLFPCITYAASDIDHDNWKQWPSVGEAQLSVFIFDVYQSRLHSPSGTYQLNKDISPHPLALSIDYQRDISQQQLLEATLEQWQKIGFGESNTTSWIQALELIFPDIEEGHNLTYVTNGANGNFYHKRSQNALPQHIGSITDERLNDAFLSIWLSPKTSYPELRSQLIGGDEQ